MKYFLFAFKKTSISALIGNKDDLWLAQTTPATLKSLSEGTLVACVGKYLRAITLKFGNQPEFNFHQSKGSSFFDKTDSLR